MKNIAQYVFHFIELTIVRGDHSHYDGVDLMFLICQVTSRDHMFKGLCKYKGGTLSWKVTILPCLVTIGLVQVKL